MQLTTTDGQEIIADRMNTKLYTFLGRAAFNHIFITAEQRGSQRIGSFVWGHNKAYPEMAAYMVAYNYPRDLDALVVPASDLEAFYTSEVVLGQDYVPEEWQ